MLTLNKTKAALQCGQSRRETRNQGQITTLVDLVNGNPQIRGLLDNHGISSKYPPLADTPQKAADTGIPVALNFEPADFPQPFGSIPRCWSSLRKMRLIQVARDESPSCLATCSNCARNSSGRRIWYWGDLFSLCVDMVVTGAYHHLHGNDHCNYSYHTKQRPGVFAAQPRRLTTNVIESNEVAMLDRNTPLTGRASLTPNLFTWRFLGVSPRYPSSRPIVVWTIAATEKEARANCAGWRLAFAARLPYHSFSIQEAHHVS